MAMIECPECGKSISDKAATCPGCGCPIASVNDKPQAAGAKCPKCGSKNLDKLQRITGYLVGTTDRWNKAKLSELNDRVIHE